MALSQTQDTSIPTRGGSRFLFWTVTKRQSTILMQGVVTLLTLLILGLYLMPLGYGVTTSLKTREQSIDADGPILPMSIKPFTYEGKDYDIYKVPTDAGVQEWALIKKGRESSQFIDPANAAAGLIEWEGRWRTLEPVYTPDAAWENYPETWDVIDYLRLLTNTLTYAFTSMIGAVVSAAFVAYGFARYRFPFKGVLFVILLATIILPPAVTLVPTYAFFSRIGWTGTYLPLIVPQFFANAYNVFLLRQYFMTIPREQDEAASIDGAGPLRIFFSIVLPQATPALTAVALFHFFYAWNDFFNPFLYLAGRNKLYPITVGLSFFNSIYTDRPHLIMAAAVISLVVPLTVFFLAQRIFIHGIVPKASGTEK